MNENEDFSEDPSQRLRDRIDYLNSLSALDRGFQVSPGAFERLSRELFPKPHTQLSGFLNPTELTTSIASKTLNQRGSVDGIVLKNQKRHIMHVIEPMKAAISKALATRSALLLIGAVIISGVGVVAALMNLFCLFGLLATVDRSANNAVINVAITVANLIVSLVVSKMLVTKHQPPDKKTL